MPKKKGSTSEQAEFTVSSPAISWEDIRYIRWDRLLGVLVVLAMPFLLFYLLKVAYGYYHAWKEREEILKRQVTVVFVTCGSCKGSGYLVRKCPNCQGKGTLDCPHCSGRGRILCPLHKNGTSGEICPACKGSGKIYLGTKPTLEPKQEPWYGTCPYCNGDGELICEFCKGYDWVLCPICNGLGKLQCPVCNGDGTVTITCSRCGGSGKIRTETIRVYVK